MDSFADLLAISVDDAPCVMGAAIVALKEADRKALEDAIVAGVTRERIAAAFTQYGFPMTSSSVGRHLRKVCKCRR